MKKTSSGFTLVELLIVITIIGLLVAILLLLNWKKQINRGNDARRKADTHLIQTAFEDYYNDHNCYPETTILNDCGGAELQPYLAVIPCDPVTKQPYLYVPSERGRCSGNRICVQLQDLSDPQITELGCNPITGCGWGPGYNYCLAEGVSVTAAGFNPLATPAPTAPVGPTSTPGPPIPTPTPSGLLYACTNTGDCNQCSNCIESGCTVYWSGGCPFVCSDHPEVWCQY